MSRNKEIAIESGSGNVFEDLGLPDAPDLLVKAELAGKIADIIDERALTQAEAAELLGTSQPTVSSLLNGRLAGFSLDRLVRFLNSLDRDVDIVVRERAAQPGPGRMRVRS